MFAEIVVSHPVAVGLVPWPYPRTTIVVKATLELGPGGLLAPVTTARDVEPLHLDVSDATGRLVAATDFAPYKPACDVLVAVQDEREHGSPGRLVLGPLDRAIAPFEPLGPVPTVMPGGDPGGDPASWAGVDARYERLQSAPPERQIPWPLGELAIDYRRGPWPFLAHHPGLLPRVELAFPDGERLQVPMALDTIEIVAIRRRVAVSFRGIAAHERDPSSARLAIELVDRLGFALGSARWQPAAAETAADRRAPVRGAQQSFTDVVEVTALAMRSPAAALPFARPDPAPRALPFTPPAAPGAPSTALDPHAFAALRRARAAPAAQPLDEALAVEETGTGTASVPASPAYVLPPAVRAIEEPPPAAPRALPADAEAPPDASELERWMRACAAVRVALWSGQPLADVLAARGLDEAAYRATEARLKRALDGELEQGRLDGSERFLRLLDEARPDASGDEEAV